MVLGWIERNMLSNNNPMNMEVVHHTCNVMVMGLDLKGKELDTHRTLSGL